MATLWCFLCRHQQQRNAAVTLQAAWRAKQPRLQYSSLQAAAYALQAAYQGFRVRQAIRQSHAFAVFLQSCCKCRRDRAAFLAKRQAAVALQAAICGWQERRRCGADWSLDSGTTTCSMFASAAASINSVNCSRSVSPGIMFNCFLRLQNKHLIHVFFVTAFVQALAATEGLLAAAVHAAGPDGTPQPAAAP